MRKSKVLQKIRDGKCARFCAMGHFLPFYIRYAAYHEFDGIWLDLEHRAMDQREVQSVLSMCHQHDIDAMVRAPTQERTKLYRYFEDGASGLLMPLVDDVQEARAIARSVKFPPIGNRGIDGAGLDADFAIDAENFTTDANAETFVILQIETLNALQQAEQIAGVEGIDGIFVGPADLSLRLGLADGAPSLDEAMQLVADAAASQGKAWGTAGGGVEEWKKYRQMGAQLLIGAGDFALRDVLEGAKNSMDEALGD
ncbi:MAG: aldolase/citrate lyase family protein [Candidatus Latescibacterota bacterium]|nr:4-hydroxy-2-oxovalerate aldolase [Gemmatimonadaceae bacterium]MDP6983964.1 aldolase/citrate lyase family protein [Candidatus Latescibacterota bacterium]MEC8991214.1 aldolase/citrate lyase family protein [Candidatus Latescibacterota bacterium]MEE3042114.1 aldolase/citrate lyase family protein [Candidatus Latescibacterota bacterium]MEE3334977.1 aldolase/citrate lyase family protein [Candidatus Latescibacterota bacterium]